MRQLLWMSDGRDRFAWSLASSLMALIANCHKSKGRALTAKDFNPALTKEERMRDAILITDDNVEIMRDEFKLMFEGGVKLTSMKIEED